MNVGEFRESLKNDAPPAGLSAALEALWWDGKGDWEKAHEAAQRDEGPDGSWVHGYLHRKRGDLSNARYWYRRADRAAGYGDSEREWDSIVGWLLRVAGDWAKVPALPRKERTGTLTRRSSWSLFSLRPELS